MSRKLKYKIISCSSQEQDFPVSSLLFAGSEGWQSRRFCTYPQEITLEFYGIVNIRKIELVSHHSKIASQVDMLFYIPTVHQEQRFYKYGYFQFNREAGTNEQKSIMVDINCLYLRFLFHKPYPSKQNFFSQIGLQSLSLYGAEAPQAALEQSPQQREDYSEEVLNQQDQAYVQERISKVVAMKEKAIADQDYTQANYFKKIISAINEIRIRLRQNRAYINHAIEKQDYDSAKTLKDKIRQQKEEIDMILEDQQTEEKRQIEPELQENQFAEMPVKSRAEGAGGNQFMEPGNLENSRASSHYGRQSRAVRSRAIQRTKEENYDDKVIPTLRPGYNKTEPPEETGEEKPKPPPPVEEVEGKYIKDATMMQEYFDEQTVKKFFSAHWQHNLDSLTTILNVLPTKHKDAGLIKCLITLVKYSSKQINFQVTLQSLKLFESTLKMNNESQALTKPGDQSNDLDDIGREIVKRLADNNAKIKTASQQTFAQMNSALLYGVEGCSMLLAKYKGKLSSKQITTRLSLLTKMVNQYGLAGGSNTVPTSALDFAIENINNPAEEVRKMSIALLGSAYKQDPNKVEPKLVNLKDSIQDLIREGGGGTGNPSAKHRKK